MSEAYREGAPPRAPRASLSSTEAAFAGLALLRREPMTWLVWAGLLLAMSLGSGLLVVSTIGPQMATLTHAGSQPDPAVVMAALGAAGPGYLLLMIVSLLFYAVVYAAVNRAILRPGAGGPGHVGVGADEARQLGTLILVGLIMFGVYLVALIGAVIVAVVAGLIGRVAGSGVGAVVGGVVLFLVVTFGVLGSVLFVGVRLSLASALTFDRGRIDVLGSWRLTRGRFWPLFGAYLLAGLTIMVMYVVLAVVFGVVALLALGGANAAGLMFNPDMSSPAAYFAAPQLVWLLMNAAFGPVVLALFIGAPAEAYAQIKAIDEPGAVFDAPPTMRFGR